MAGQMAKHIFNVSRVITLVHDPIREEMYSSLGLRTVSPTRIVTRSLREALLADDAGGEAGEAEATPAGNEG
jgi:Trk K+ transport system NAD-binding subunit